MDDGDTFEERLRAFAREIGRTVEQAAEQIDLEEIADRIGVSSERVREFAEYAGQWLSTQFGDEHHDDGAASGGFPDAADEPITPVAPVAPDAADGNAHASTSSTASAANDGSRRPGPHPLDIPTEEQGLALSALDSGRWRVEPGTNELIAGGDGPDPQDVLGIASELRARDWIAASGEVTLVGRDALRRWLDRAHG